MQEPVDKNLQISILLGKTIEDLRINKKKLSLNKFANEYEIGKTTVHKIENALVECKLVTAWKIANALDMKLSDLVKILETQLGDDFKLIDE